jgi:hypothetical protein
VCVRTYIKILKLATIFFFVVVVTKPLLQFVLRYVVNGRADLLTGGESNYLADVLRRTLALFGDEHARELRGEAAAMTAAMLNLLSRSDWIAVRCFLDDSASLLQSKLDARIRRRRRRQFLVFRGRFGSLSLSTSFFIVPSNFY